LKRFGISHYNHEDIELEVLAQLKRMRRRQAYYDFLRLFNNASQANRIQLVKTSMGPRQLKYALRHSEAEKFETLLSIVMAKDGFGPQTLQDMDLLDFLNKNRRLALVQRDKETAAKWRAVIAQLVSQPVGREHGRLPFGKSELFAMMRNAERTLEQRKRAFIDITSITDLDKESASYAYEIIKMMGTDAKPTQKHQLIAYGFLGNGLASELQKLRQIYEDILSNKESGQAETTLRSIRQKKELLEILDSAVSKRIETHLQAERIILLRLVRNILNKREEPYRLPFIRGIILLKVGEGRLAYRFIEGFPMIVAGDTYPYQWKHDNEVNIALLLANVDPYQAAQAVRFIIYHGMWRGEQARKLGLFGWLPQIIFGNRQTGKLPELNHKIYYYFPDFRFRPTKKIDEENERNRTSEITQLPFFGWAVWRVYEGLEKVNEEHALAFLKEVYPYVRANTEAIRTALDPYDEAALSGRDAWVNGMDNAWYHLMVMNRHLPERLIPKWAMDIVEKNRVDNRVNKKPGNPVDPKLAEGRPSDYYYSSKIVFYNIVKELGLDPLAVYHATPYNAKDVAITAVMARSLEAQIAMAKVLKDTDADLQRVSGLRGRKNELVERWDEEINRYQSYLDRMKKAVNRYLWSPGDKIYYNRDVTQMFPDIVEQFNHVRRDKLGNIKYEPNPKYWTWVKDKKSGGHYELNERAKRLIGQGARKIVDGDLLRSPAIAGFFPLFAHIPSDEQAFQLSLRVVNPWMWWPVNGIPIPSQPMMLLGPDGRYVPNEVYDPNKYWLGPTWMVATKPVIDGFRSYGYEMIYLYLVQLTVGTLADGRAVEHWKPETGEVNTSNVNFPWAASAMAGSIWRELTKEEQAEYLRRFHPRRVH
jgi:hypothetical protein